MSKHPTCECWEWSGDDPLGRIEPHWFAPAAVAYGLDWIGEIFNFCPICGELAKEDEA